MRWPSGKTIAAIVIGAAIAGGFAVWRLRGGSRAGAATPEEAVRRALEAAARGEDAAAFLLDSPRCRSLYASDAAPPISNLGRASDLASCERSAEILHEAFGRLGAVTFDIGARTTDRFGRTAFPVTLHTHAGAEQLVELCTVPVDGRYFVGAKVDAPDANLARPVPR